MLIECDSLRNAEMLVFIDIILAYPLSVEFTVWNMLPINSLILVQGPESIANNVP